MCIQSIIHHRQEADSQHAHAFAWVLMCSEQVWQQPACTLCCYQACNAVHKFAWGCHFKLYVTSCHAACFCTWFVAECRQHEADLGSTTVDKDSLQAWQLCHHLYCLLHKHLYVLCRIVQHMHQLRCDWCHIYSHAQVPLSLTQASSAHQLKLARHVCLSHVLLQLLLRFYQFGSDTDTLAIQCESHS